MYEVAAKVVDRFGRYVTMTEIAIDKHRASGQFICPSCAYTGAFAASNSATGRRPYAICPGCGARERHRLQSLVLDTLVKRHDFSAFSVLHIAPEGSIERRLRSASAEYITADINPIGVDMQVDLTHIDQPDSRYDVVYASHVLEHISNDSDALREIARVLRPGGFAVLPVPIVGTATIEYPKAVPSEEYHVRGPGPDYYDRYDTYFDRVERFRSSDFSEEYQTWVYEDRSRYPNQWCPYRQPTLGARHMDIVPVAYL